MCIPKFEDTVVWITVWLTITRTGFKRFYIDTLHCFALGKHVAKSLRWLHDAMADKAAPIVSKRVDDFRERTQPQLGKVHDPWVHNYIYSKAKEKSLIMSQRNSDGNKPYKSLLPIFVFIAE